jgi:hypothetical protein
MRSSFPILSGSSCVGAYSANSTVRVRYAKKPIICGPDADTRQHLPRRWDAGGAPPHVVLDPEAQCRADSLSAAERFMVANDFDACVGQ